MKIVFENKRRIKESLSYGELAAIQDEWEKFKKKTGRNDSGAAWEFIETECAGVYDTEEEQDEVFTVISTLEESIKKRISKNKKRMGEGSQRKFSRRRLKESAYGGTTVDDVAEFVFDNYLMQEDEVDMEDLMYEFSASHYDIPESFFKEAIDKAEYAYGILADNTYREDRYAKDMLQLSDNHTLYKLNGTDDYNGPDDQVWTDIVNMKAHDFEEDTGVELYILGRGGRHICVEPTYSNCIRFDELQAEQRFLEQDAINTFNGWVEEYKKENAVDESLRPVRRNKK